MASQKRQNSELIRRISVVALEPQHNEELRNETHATLKVLLQPFLVLLGLLGVTAASQSVRLLTASVEKSYRYRSHNCVPWSGGTKAMKCKTYRSSCEQAVKTKQGKPAFLCWICNKMCQALLSPKEALVLLVFGEKNKTNNRKRDYCLWTEEFILLWN